MTSGSLTVDTAVPYLLERGLVSEAAIVESDLQVIDAGRRNQNLKVVRRRGPSYLIKQPGEGEYGSEATIRCEAAFYEHCGLEPRAAEGRDLLPACHGFDSQQVLLVLELIEGDPLWGHPAANPEGFSFEAAEPLGTARAAFRR